MPTAYSDAESDVTEIQEPQIKPTFFSDISLCEFAFGIGAVKLNCLCFGMTLNIPTLTLHNIMYKIAPKGLLHGDTTDQDRISVCKAIIDHWMALTKDMSDKKRFKQLYNAFIALKEKSLAEELKKKFDTNEPVQLEMFYKLDCGRLGPWVPPVAESVVVVSSSSSNTSAEASSEASGSEGSSGEM